MSAAWPIGAGEPERPALGPHGGLVPAPVAAGDAELPAPLPATVEALRTADAAAISHSLDPDHANLATLFGLQETIDRDLAHLSKQVSAAEARSPDAARDRLGHATHAVMAARLERLAVLRNRVSLAQTAQVGGAGEERPAAARDLDRLLDFRLAQLRLAEAHRDYVMAGLAWEQAGGARAAPHVHERLRAAAVEVDAVVRALERDGLVRARDAALQQLIDDWTPRSADEEDDARLAAAYATRGLQTMAVMVLAEQLLHCYAAGALDGTQPGGARPFTDSIERCVRQSVLREQVMMAHPLILAYGSTAGELIPFFQAELAAVQNAMYWGNVFAMAQLAVTQHLRADFEAAEQAYAALQKASQPYMRAQYEMVRTDVPSPLREDLTARRAAAGGGDLPAEWSPRASQALAWASRTLAEGDQGLANAEPAFRTAVERFRSPKLSELLHHMRNALLELAAAIRFRPEQTLPELPLTPMTDFGARVARLSPVLTGPPAERRVEAVAHLLGSDALRDLCVQEGPGGLPLAG